MSESPIDLKRKKRSLFTDRWVWIMAWRDARHNFSRLFLFTASLVTGIAAVVAIGSLNYSLQEDLDRNAKELLGADVIVNSSKKTTPEFNDLIDSLKLETAGDADMASMVLFVKSQQSRLIKLTALVGSYPFYGKIETLPVSAYDSMKTGRYALLDQSLARQFDVQRLDSIKVGNSKLPVAGVVTRMPGSGAFSTTMAPAVYISMSALDSTHLVQFGSRVNYSLYLKSTSEAQTKSVVKKLEEVRKHFGVQVETVEGRKKGLGQAFQSVYRFFSMLAFVALILGCLGVASSVTIYAREKREEVAVLRCVGTSGWQAFNIYFIQVFVLGLIGSVIGSALGLGIQQVIPIVFRDFVPPEITLGISWRAVGEGLVLGTVVSLLFTILPLISVRFVPPLTVLRADFNPAAAFSKSRWIVIVLIVLFPIAAAAYQTESILMGLYFSLGIAVALGCLLLVAMGLLWLVRRYFPSNASFVFRHALSNLFRPNNQTRVLMVAIGLGAFIIATMDITQNSLLHQVEFREKTNESNTILFDIQSSQKDGVVALMKKHHLTANQIVPMVTCRLQEVKGVSTEVLQKDTTAKIPDWALTREYRVTYRDSLRGSEELIKGEIQRLKRGERDSIGITISEDMLDRLKLKVGDSLVFNVQGVMVQTHINGVRKVEWPKDPPNFVFVFPSGVLEQAPQIWVAAMRVDAQVGAPAFQQELVNQFPNVSLIDLRLVLKTVNELFDKISMVIRFLAMFSIVTGLIVLAGAVMNSKFVRMKEYVLLRTMGARTRQITMITLIEYAYLGLFSALTGILLALSAGFLLTKFFFKIQFAFNALELTAIGFGVALLSVLIGWWNSREVITTPPLQVLRKES